MAKKVSKRRAWTKEDVRTLKTLARKKTHAARIAKTLKRTVGACARRLHSSSVLHQPSSNWKEPIRSFLRDRTLSKSPPPGEALDDEIALRLAAKLFDRRLIQNQYRSAYIEAMIEPYLEPDGWRYVGDDWRG